MSFQFIAGRFKGWSSDGTPLASGRLYTYASGTTTHKNAFADATASTPCSYTSDGVGGQYIALDARGEAQVWLGAGAYTFALKTSAGASVYTVDGVVDPADALATDLANDTDAAKGAGMVGYKGRTLAAVLDDCFNVKSYGAVGDGVTDDYASLQQAISEASAAGKKLYWPKGIYYISATLIVTSKTNWVGDGAGYTIIKQSGLLQNIVNDDNSAMEDVSIDGIGFDFNGYNTTNFGTAMQFNAASHDRFRITNTRVFDSNYPGDGIVKQRQGLYIGQFNENVWVLNNDFSHGARIKVGRGGRNVFIKHNKLEYIDDNAITMAMLGTLAAPVGDYTQNVHIEDNIIINPTGNGIFIGADGSDKDDPAMYIKNVSVSRNIVLLDTPNTDGGNTPRFIIFTAPAGGASDVAINDNMLVMTTNTPDAGSSEAIRVGATTNPAGTMTRLSVRNNKIYSPYQRESAIYIGCAYATDDLVISGNEIQGYADCIHLALPPAHNRPTIADNTIRGAQRGLRIGGNPTVVSGTYSRNRIVSPTTGADVFSSTNAMEWRIDSNDVLDSAGAAVELVGAGTKDFYFVNNDWRGAASGPITLSGGAALSNDSARLDNLGDTSLSQVASAATITIPHARIVSISGTTNIDTITATGRAGQVVTLRFGGVLTVNDGTGNLRLAGNFTTSVNDTLTLACTGTDWEEVARSAN